MTAMEAIAELNELEPNQYSNELKLRWLQDLDGKIYEELIEGHCDEDTEESYESADYTDTEVELLVPAPYARDVYINYLRSRIAEANAETERYNLYASAYNGEYGEYAAWYNRNTPLKKQSGWRY